MNFQIQRARQYYKDAERGIRVLSRDSRWPVWSALMLYQGILDMIEANEYDVFSKRAFVPNFKIYFHDSIFNKILSVSNTFISAISLTFDSILRANLTFRNYNTINST